MPVADLLILLAGSGVTIGAILFGRRYGGGAALEQLERANRVLTNRVTELEASDLVKTRRIGELEASRDLSKVVEPLRAELAKHEQSAEHRTDRLLDVLNLIAERVGPEAA